MKIAAAIVNFQSAQETVQRVRELYDMGLRAIVVDNSPGSLDAEMLEPVTSLGAELIRSTRNGGYGAGMNMAMSRAIERGYEWAWLINPDSLPTQEALASLQRRLDDSVGLLVPKQVTGPADHPETYVSAAMRHSHKYRPLLCEGCSDGAHDVAVATGTGLLVRLESWFDVGGFHEGYFHYKEEFELSERIARTQRVILVCSAEVWHERGGSLAHASKRATYYRVRNEFLFAHRNGGLIWRRRIRLLIGSLRLATPRTLSAVALGIIDGFRQRDGMAPW